MVDVAEQELARLVRDRAAAVGAAIPDLRAAGVPAEEVPDAEVERLFDQRVLVSMDGQAG
ncbi:hypothetical protein [Streptacidiphilus melanogenes]|uniref:hypothetical protein n=1 Tax=Streptacidiphilus melanogenes TaxID=411235 RepID=UPI0005A9E371|nr:hypothetical protein [Streptacidiphilus melanogenes]